MVEWPKLNQILKPCIGDNIAIIRDSLKENMLLVDLRDLFVIMSDSDAEKDFSTEAVEQAKGDVLILGFGLGFILIPMMNKPEVTSITVIEINPEVIGLVASQIKLNDKVKIILANALTYIPDRLYDFIWYDIEISSRDIETYLNANWLDRYNDFLKPNGKYLRWEDDGKYR